MKFVIRKLGVPHSERYWNSAKGTWVKLDESSDFALEAEAKAVKTFLETIYDTDIMILGYKE